MEKGKSDVLEEWVAECLRQAPWTIHVDAIDGWARGVKWSHPPGVHARDANEALAGELHRIAGALTCAADILDPVTSGMSGEEADRYYRELQAEEGRLDGP